MKWNTLKYLFKEGIVGLWKNRTMALASSGTILLCLIILGVSYSIGNNIEYMLRQIESQFGIACYVADDTTSDRIEEINAAITKVPHVTNVKYITKEQALELFAQDNMDDAAFAQFQQDNPLPASFEIQVDSVEYQKQVVDNLKTFEELEISYFEKETGVFLKLNRTIGIVSMGIIIALIIIGLLLMSNTIKLTVYVRKKEINIMKYIGATDTFIRLPFLIEGMLIGIIGSLLATVVVMSGYKWASEFLLTHLQGVLSDISFTPVNEIMTTLIPIFIAIGVGIGFIGSAMAIRRHLKV